MSGITVNESNVRFHYATGGAGVAMAEAVTSDELWRLMHVRLHLSGASGAENFTVQIASAQAAVHDTRLSIVAMNALTESVIDFGDGSDGIILHEDDVVNFIYANATAQISWGLEVIWRSVGKGAAA